MTAHRRRICSEIRNPSGSALVQQHKLTLATQICQSRLALAVLSCPRWELEVFAQGAVFAIYLPFDRPVPKGSIAEEQGQGCPHDCGADKHWLFHPPPRTVFSPGTDCSGSSRSHGCDVVHTIRQFWGQNRLSALIRGKAMPTLLRGHPANRSATVGASVSGDTTN